MMVCCRWVSFLLLSAVSSGASFASFLEKDVSKESGAVSLCSDEVFANEVGLEEMRQSFDKILRASVSSCADIDGAVSDAYVVSFARFARFYSWKEHVEKGRSSYTCSRDEVKRLGRLYCDEYVLKCISEDSGSFLDLLEDLAVPVCEFGSKMAFQAVCDRSKQGQ